MVATEYQEQIRKNLREEQMDPECQELKKQVKALLRFRNSKITDLRALTITLDALREFILEEI